MNETHKIHFNKKIFIKNHSFNENLKWTNHGRILSVLIVASKVLSNSARLFSSIFPSHKSVEAHFRNFLITSVNYFDSFIYCFGYLFSIQIRSSNRHGLLYSNFSTLCFKIARRYRFFINQLFLIRSSWFLLKYYSTFCVLVPFTSCCEWLNHALQNS